MLTRHPDQYSNTELDDWIRHLVDNLEPEGSLLDYKETISLSRQNEKKELAKDVSSFANENGGTLIYGVPEQRAGSRAAPVPTRPYGIDPIPRLGEDLENVLSTTISPIIPEVRVREILLSDYPGKACYLVWTPQSWTGPHMVHGYKDARYYRRGNFRAIPMSERDVEIRYQQRLSLRSAAQEFSTSQAAWHLMQFYGRRQAKTRLMIVPTYLIENRVHFSGAPEREWLADNTLWRGWLPSTYGVRTFVDRSDKKADVEIHRNGAIVACHYTHGSSNESPGTIAEITELGHLLEMIEFAAMFYQFQSYSGALSIYLEVHCPPGGHYLILPRMSGQHLELAPTGTSINILVEPAASEMTASPMTILRSLADRIFQAFGLWEADCITEGGEFVRSA